jgi:UDP-N-acetylmuramyl pentapeptide phosphotransferase/UDP-N-acetylglucosamine-1-phosphate transferase
MPLSLGLSISTFFLAALITWGWIKIARRKNIYDIPERRRLHQASIPRAGGISIALIMAVSTVVIFLNFDVSAYWPLVVTGIVLYGSLGFLDDLKTLRSGTKLSLHLLAALIIFLMAALLASSNLMVSISISIAYLLLVNVWNFMDGSNGLVSVQSLIMVAGLIALSYFSTSIYYFALTLAACCLGFLPFNFPIARVFLGDVGSHVLGAALVGLAVLAFDAGQWTPLEMLCLSSALWVDAVLTFIRRAFRGFKVTKAHRSHLYQYAIRSGSSHAAVCAYYAFWTIAVVAIVGFSRQMPESSQQILLFAIIVTACVLHQCFRLFVLKSSRRSKNLKLSSQ